jgi:hypothetical protein
VGASHFVSFRLTALTAPGAWRPLEREIAGKRRSGRSRPFEKEGAKTLTFSKITLKKSTGAFSSPNDKIKRMLYRILRIGAA